MNDDQDESVQRSLFPAHGRGLSPRATACVTASSEGIEIRCDDSSRPSFWLETQIPWQCVHDLLGSSMKMLVTTLPELFTEIPGSPSYDSAASAFCPECREPVRSDDPALFCGTQCAERFSKRMKGFVLSLSQQRFSVMKTRSQTFLIDLEFDSSASRTHVDEVPPFVPDSSAPVELSDFEEGVSLE